MNNPTLEDNRGDFDRLQASLPDKNYRINLEVLRTLPQILRDSSFFVTAVLNGKNILAVEPGDTSLRLFGVAFDIGTTTLAGTLINLKNGEVLAADSAANPQQAFGADVISRISYSAHSPEALKSLQSLVINALNGLIYELLAKADVAREEVYEAVAVGNTTMSHLFLGIDPVGLAAAPFITAFSQAVEVSALELGLNINPLGRILILPNIAGYVGSDTVAMILACGLDEGENIRLAIDIGTNGEVVLAGKGRILVCSTAAGPAFEGMQIQNGMRAADGAIEAVFFKDEGLNLKVIGNSPPRGICGSGIIDSAAVMLAAGIIDQAGRILRPEITKALPLQDRLCQDDRGMKFVLVPAHSSSSGTDIAITQKDIRELQLAKGAVHAGVNVLMREMGININDVSQVFLAGAFGNYIRRESAISVGLLPEIPLNKIVPAGNAAGEGAARALININERARALAVAQKAEHIELSARKDFQEEFLNRLNFPPISAP